MSKVTNLLIICLLTLSTSHAQDGAADQGMYFVKGLSWQQVLAKAKAENKYIFVDCFTTWCGPCRQMANYIFPKKEVGDFMNKNFLNVKVQMDVTAGDNQEVVNWYKDAKLIEGKYKVRAYPIFLIFTPEGEWVYKMLGAFSDPASFIESMSKALETDEQYYFLLDRYNRGEKDPDFLANLLKAAQKAGDEKIILQLKKEQNKTASKSATTMN